MPPKVHVLKIHPEYFKAVCNGKKKFEVRKNDRDYRVGDILKLRAWDPETQEYTGEHIFKRVTYVHSGLGMENGFVCLSLG